MRFSIEGLELLEVNESEEAIGVASKAPGYCLPVLGIVGAIGSAALPRRCADLRLAASSFAQSARWASPSRASL